MLNVSLLVDPRFPLLDYHTTTRIDASVTATQGEGGGVIGRFNGTVEGYGMGRATQERDTDSPNPGHNKGWLNSIYFNLFDELNQAIGKPGFFNVQVRYAPLRRQYEVYVDIPPYGSPENPYDSLSVTLRDQPDYHTRALSADWTWLGFDITNPRLDNTPVMASDRSSTLVFLPDPTNPFVRTSSQPLGLWCPHRKTSWELGIEGGLSSRQTRSPYFTGQVATRAISATRTLNLIWKGVPSALIHRLHTANIPSPGWSSAARIQDYQPLNAGGEVHHSGFWPWALSTAWADLSISNWPMRPMYGQLETQKNYLPVGAKGRPVGINLGYVNSVSQVISPITLLDYTPAQGGNPVIDRRAQVLEWMGTGYQGPSHILDFLRIGTAHEWGALEQHARMSTQHRLYDVELPFLDVTPRAPLLVPDNGGQTATVKTSRRPGGLA